VTVNLRVGTWGAPGPILASANATVTEPWYDVTEHFFFFGTLYDVELDDESLILEIDYHGPEEWDTHLYWDSAQYPSGLLAVDMTPIRVCGTGGVDAANTGPVDVLMINSSAGGDDRTVTVFRGFPVAVSLGVSPAGPNPASFALYVWMGEPSQATITPHPKNLGNMCFPSPLTGGTPQPKKIWNTIGRYPYLGYPDYPCGPAPCIVFQKASGFDRALTATFQGILLDNGSTATKPASLTNAIVLDVP
jgi:hypothetical protein